MKKLILIIALMSSLNADLAGDKFKHAAAGFLIYGGCLIVADMTHMNNPVGYCLIPVVAAGIGKELYDEKGELNDVLATVAVPAALSTSFVLLKW